MASLTVQTPGLTGSDLTFGSAESGGDSFPNDGKTRLFVKNGDASAHTATVARARQCDMGQTHDVAVAVPAGEERVIGPFPTDEFGSPVAVTYDAVTSVTVAAFR